MRYWKSSASAVIALVLVAACAASSGAGLQVRGARIAQGVLTAQLDWQPSSEVLDALDHGIALDFVIDVRAQAAPRLGWRTTLARAQRHVELRYFPLSRRYQLRDLDRNETRSYAARSLLLAALEELRLDLPGDWPRGGVDSYALQVELDRDRLPAALRLPALLQRQWHVASGDYRWPAAGAG
jgi:hypothetical protein